MELSSVDLHYVVKELQALSGGKVEKVFQSDKDKRDLFFVIYVQNAPKANLRFLLPGMIATSAKPSYPQNPPGFAMFLRKHLGGTRVTSVRQRGFDRILEIGFASKEQEYTLVIELIPPGNMLLTHEGRIINLLENQNFKDRALRGKQPYVAPPPSFDIANASEEEIAQRIAVSTRDSLVTTLAIHLGLGGAYAEEVCARSGIAKHRNDLSHHEVTQVAGAVKAILDQPIAAHVDSKRAYPFRLESRECAPYEQTSFLAAIASFMGEDVKVVEEKHDHKVKTDKVQAIIDAQTRQVAKFEDDARIEQRKGERIYEEYQILSEIIAAAREARERKQNITDALKRFPQVKGYKDATGEIEIEIADAAEDS